MKAVNSVQRAAGQVNSVMERVDRLTKGPLARIVQVVDGPLARWEENSGLLLQQESSLRRFQRITKDLDRHQYTRVTRILEGWSGPAPAPQPSGDLSPLEWFIAWVNRRRRPSAFELYLRRAHEHPAVARRDGGRRLWFEEWRRAVLLAMADGVGLEDLRAAAHAISPPHRRRGGSPPPRQQTAGRCFQERLRHAIFTHGPTRGPRPSRPVEGDGPLVPIG
ncbi:MAG: hypothetical protein ACJ76D_10875 [Solirubrobacterales bacterium]